MPMAFTVHEDVAGHHWFRITSIKRKCQDRGISQYLYRSDIRVCGTPFVSFRRPFRVADVLLCAGEDGGLVMNAAIGAYRSILR